MPTNSQPSNQPKSKEVSTNTFIVLCVVISLIIVIVAGVISKGLVSTVLLNNRVISKKNKATKQLDDNIAAAHQLSDQYNATIKSQQDLIFGSMPAEKDFSGLAAQLELVSGISGAKWNNINQNNATATTTPGSTAPAAATGAPTNSQLQFLTAQYEFHGPYTAVMNELGNFEKMARPVTVNHITFSGTNSDLLVDVGITSYYIPPYQIIDKTEEVK